MVNNAHRWNTKKVNLQQGCNKQCNKHKRNWYFVCCNAWYVWLVLYFFITYITTLSVIQSAQSFRCLKNRWWWKDLLQAAEITLFDLLWISHKRSLLLPKFNINLISTMILVKQKIYNFLGFWFGSKHFKSEDG